MTTSNGSLLRGIRWLLLLPASLAAGYLAAGLVALLPASAEGGAGEALAHLAAFAAGLLHVGAALLVAGALAPSHARAAVAVLAVLLVGDLAFVHFVLPDLLGEPGSGTAAEALEPLLVLLRAGEHAELAHGGAAKLAGALAACLAVWRAGRRRRRAGTAGTLR